MPLDPHNGHLLRAQTTAALSLIELQLQADVLRLRTTEEDRRTQKRARALAELAARVRSEKDIAADETPWSTPRPPTNGPQR